MRILLYNFLQPEEWGAGGAGKYHHSLIRALQSLGHDVIAMSSGSRYSLYPAKPHIKFDMDVYERAIVFNSPVLAPARFNFATPSTYAENKELDFIPQSLFERYGRIDAFHFQNIEGLTSSFFYALRKTFPESKMIYSVHNYNLVCPMANLWHQDQVACEDYQSGTRCVVCQSEVHDPEEIRWARKLELVATVLPGAASLLSGARRLTGRTPYRQGRQPRSPNPGNEGAGEGVKLPAAADYANFRNINIGLCSAVFDHVLAVSARTRDVIVSMGIPAEKTAVSYIGTKNKTTFERSTKITDVGPGLHLAYLGYMYRKKGFGFLLEVLERLPQDVAATVSVTVAVEMLNADLHSQLQALRKTCRKITYYDGYSPEELDKILAGVNLGIVPVLWEDNLPQVAIEMVARGIPILTSDRGGAQEIANNPNFVYRAESHASLVEKITAIVRREVSLGDFWGEKIMLFSVEEHVSELMQYYKGISANPVSASRLPAAIPEGPGGEAADIGRPVESL